MPADPGAQPIRLDLPVSFDHGHKEGEGTSFTPATAPLPATDIEVYRVALEAVSQGICYFDSDETLIVCNPAYASIYHLKTEDVRRGAKLREIVERRVAAGASPMSADEYIAFVRPINSGDKVKVWDQTLTDGRTIRVRHRPMPNGGWVSTHEDITALVESRVIANERLSLQALADLVPDYLWVKDLESRFVIVNAAVARDSGRSSGGELIGLSDFDIHDSAMAEGFRAIEKTIMETGEPMIDREEWTTDSHGGRKCMLSTKMPLRNYRGEVIGLVGVARDITARKLASALRDGEAELLQSMASLAPPPEVLGRLAQLIESQVAGARVAVLSVGPDGASLRSLASPSLPEAYRRAINLVRLPSHVSPCAAAASYREAVIVADASSDPLWRDNMDWAASNQLPTCWATPIENRRGGLLGVLVVYSALCREPNDVEANLMQVAACLASLAIDSNVGLVAGPAAARAF